MMPLNAGTRREEESSWYLLVDGAVIPVMMALAPERKESAAAVKTVEKRILMVEIE